MALLDLTETLIFISDASNYQIKMLNLTSNLVSTISGSISQNLDGNFTVANFVYPSGMVQNTEILYVMDNTRLRTLNFTSSNYFIYF